MKNDRHLNMSHFLLLGVEGGGGLIRGTLQHIIRICPVLIWSLRHKGHSLLMKYDVIILGRRYLSDNSGSKPP